MKRARSIEGLDTALTDALAWRRHELSVLSSQLSRAKPGSPLEHCLLRASVALLYAHWEGFIGEASRLYAAHVAQKRLQFRELSSPLLSLAVRGLLVQATATRKAWIHRKLVDFFMEDLSKTCDVPLHDFVGTSSNLTSEVFSDVCTTLGIHYGSFEPKFKLIDERLVRNRNAIAHGEFLAVDRVMYEELRTEVLDMMTLFRDLLSNAAATGSFRRAASALDERQPDEQLVIDPRITSP